MKPYTEPVGEPLSSVCSNCHKGRRMTCGVMACTGCDYVGSWPKVIEMRARGS